MHKAVSIGRNIGFLSLNRIVTVAISLFLFPFIVNHVGKEIYGLYLIVMMITGYFGIMDFGVMSALTKYVSEFSGKKDLQKISDIINASFSFYVLIGVIIGLLLFSLSFFFARFFKIDPSNIQTAQKLFIIAGMSAFFIWPLSTFRGTIQGLNLWGVDAVTNIMVQIINATATFLILRAGHGIICLFVVAQTLTVLGSVTLYFVVRKKISYRPKFPYIEKETFRFIFNFSFFMFINSIIGILVFQVHNIIIGYFVSVSAVSLYAVAYNIQNYVRTINSTLGGPPWTIASAMEGKGDYDGQRSLLFKGTRYMTALFLPIILIVFFFTEPFIKYWMGPGFRESVLPARIVILFWLFNGTTELATGMLSAKGIVKEQVIIQLAIAAANITIALSLVKILGITAVAIGLTASMVLVGFPLLLRLSLKSLKITFT